jgi:ATP adenylyltransferase
VDEIKSLWAPWRMVYIQGPSPQECIFCKASKEDRDQENLVLYRSRTIFVMMNRFPYAYGHLLVCPVQHVRDLGGLPDHALGELMQVTRDAIHILQRSLNPDGFNMGINLGGVAGAGYVEHLHMHIVPRWHGDHNFMPIIGETRVISEHLAHTYGRLREGFDLLASDSPGS